MLCLSAPCENLRSRAIIWSVVAQALAVTLAAVAFAWPFALNELKTLEVGLLFVSAAVLCHFISAMYFSEFLFQIASHFERPDLTDLARSMKRALGEFVVVMSVALSVIVGAFAIVAVGLTLVFLS